MYRVRGDVVGEVVPLRQVPCNRAGVARQGRLVLRSLAGEKSVEIFEAITGWPIVEGSLGGDLFLRCIVPLAPSPGVVAVVLENFGNGGRGFWYHPAEPIEIIGNRRNLTIANPGMIATGQ